MDCRRYRVLLALSGLVALATASSCAQRNGDLSRVQPNAVRKSDLVEGIWYFRNTVTKAPPTTGFTYPGQMGELEKVVWDIGEHYLVGYRAYPLIPGAESGSVEATSRPSGTTAKVCGPDGVCKGGQPYYGAPIVSYPIRSHFDIQRNYNPATGEQGNVILENATDRPWAERQFLRVDWSANVLNQSRGGMGWNPVLNPAGASDVSAWVQPGDPGSDPDDWPRREEDASGRLTYFDFTARYFAQPDETYIEGYGSYPICFLSPRYDCTAAEVHVRSSFAKVDPDVTNDYVPLVYDNEAMSKFGFFRTERLNYDRKFGTTESARIRLANRFRMFERSYSADAHGRPDPTQPLPVELRKLKPIVYYLHPSTQVLGEARAAEVRTGARALEKGWDAAFRRAAAAAQGKPVEEIPQLLYVCENPVPPGAPEACGPEGFEARYGDLRYSFLKTVAEPSPNGLLGYGPSSADPETGEIISANANIYSANIDGQVQYAMDIIDTMVGAKSLDELVSGKDVREYIAKNPAYAAALKNKGTGALQAGLQGIPESSAESAGAFAKPAARLSELMQGLSASGGLTAASSDKLKAAAERLKSRPDLEALVLDNPDFQHDQVAMLPDALAARAAVDPGYAREASRMALTSPLERMGLYQRRLDWAARNNLYLDDFLDRPMLGLAYREQTKRQARIIELQAQGSNLCQRKTACSESEAVRIASEEIRGRLWQVVWSTIAEHEFGHTVGLRHNFQGSFDALNYPAEYWRIRQPTLTVQQGGVAKVPRTPKDLKAAADGTELQLVQGLHDYEYASIMDYGTLNAQQKGIGKYDFAAILFAYSGDSSPGFVEVFSAARKQAKSFPGSDGNQLTVTGAAFDLPLANAQKSRVGVPGYGERYHYSLLPLHLGDGADLGQTLASGISRLEQRTLRRWSEVKEAQARVAGLLKTNPSPTPADLDALGDVPLEVPYLFCSDSERGALPSCDWFDLGPDLYEKVRNRLEGYWNSYYWTHFKRDRLLFSPNSAANQAYSTFDDLGTLYKHWVHAYFRQTTAGQQLFPRYAYDATVQDTWTMGVLDGVNAMLAVLAVPPAGLFMYRTGPGSPRWDVVSEGVDFDQLSPTGEARLRNYYSDTSRWQFPAEAFATARRGEGRRMYSRYDFKSGFGFFNRLLEVGHYHDQMGAMIAAVQPQASFLGVDALEDQRRYLIPYYLVFKKELTDVFSSLWSRSEDDVRPVMHFVKDDTGYVTTAPGVAARTLAWGGDLIAGFDYPERRERTCGGPVTQGCIDPQQMPAPVSVQLTWTSRIYALYLGMALFSVNFDLDYAKSNLVFKLGGGEQVTAEPGFHVLELADLTSGARYAVLEKDGAPPASTPAVRLLRLAEAYKKVVDDPGICPMPTVPTKGGAVTETGACLTAEEKADPARVEQRRKDYTEAFKNAVRDLDIMRGFYGLFGRAL